MAKVLRLFLVLLILFFSNGCAAKIPHMIVTEYAKRGTRFIAVLPVQNGSSDQRAAEMLRNRLVDELYFKGYPRIPLKLIDDRMADISAAGGEKATPKSLGETLNVDAVLYTTLREGRMGQGIVYARTVVDAEFELRSAKTGESLWHVQYRTVYHHFGFSRRQLELKTSQVYEPAIQELVTRVLLTLPDGTDASGA
jgi:hypothetical protein